jgi:hypothetical protein
MTLTDLFAYDPATGELRWKERQGTPKKVARFNRNSAGRIAGVKAYTGTDKKTPRGIVIRVRGMASKDQYAHRIIWEMANGPIPDGYLIDHINGNAFDNRLSNLRLATHSQNLHNMKLRPTSASRLKGVRYEKGRNRWSAEIRANGVRHRLGYFQTKGLAAVARAKAAIRFHGSFARFA